MAWSPNEFVYELKVESGPLDYLSLAIATERHSGQTREIHHATPTLNANGGYSNKLNVVIKDANAICHAHQITLCALLPSGGITAQAYLIKDHMTTDLVIRTVELYTCDYDVRIQKGIRNTINGQFGKQKAQGLLSVEIRAIHVSSAVAAAQAASSDSIRKRITKGLEKHNKIVKEETDALRRLDGDVKREVEYTMSHSGSPLVEVVLMRAPQKLVMLKRHQSRGNKYIRIKSVTPNEYCVLREAYFTTAIGNTISTPVQQYDKHYFKVLYKHATEVLDLVNIASINPSQAKSQIQKERRTTHETVDRYVQSIKNAHADNGGWFTRMTGLAALTSEPTTLLDYLWMDLMTASGPFSYSEMSIQTRNFFALFMPLTHGDFGPTSAHDPYQLDQSFLPSKGKLVGMELFFNSDCETLSSRCLAYWKAQRDLVHACLEQPVLLDDFVSGADKMCFMTFALQILSMATYPCNGLIQCTTNIGEHVTHCSLSPMESWNTENGIMRDMYTEGMLLRKNCKKLLGIAMDCFNKEANRVIGTRTAKGGLPLITAGTDELLEKTRGLFQYKDVRVQDCTVACKTPNSFGFYTKLVGFYPYVYGDHSVRHFAPDMHAKDNKSSRDFKRTLEGCIAKPDNLFWDCGLGASKQHVAELSRCQSQRLHEMANIECKMFVSAAAAASGRGSNA